MIRKITWMVALMLIHSVLIQSMVAVAEESSGNPEKEAAAVSAAEKWLAMIDEGKYAESWKEAAELLRNAVKQEQWEQSMQGGRAPLGKLITRELKAKNYRTTLPGAPDGEYVVIEFETSFENKKLAVETVTPMLEKDGSWRVSGYFIR